MSSSRKGLKQLDSSSSLSTDSGVLSSSSSTTSENLYTTYGILCEVFARDVTKGGPRHHSHHRHHHNGRDDGVGINVDDDDDHDIVVDTEHITGGNNNNNNNNNYQGNNRRDIMCNYMLLSLHELFELAGKVGNDEAGE